MSVSTYGLNLVERVNVEFALFPCFSTKGICNFLSQVSLGCLPQSCLGFLRQLLHGHCAMRSGFTCARTRTATYVRTDNVRTATASQHFALNFFLRRTYGSARTRGTFQASPETGWLPNEALRHRKVRTQGRTRYTRASIYVCTYPACASHRRDRTGAPRRPLSASRQNQRHSGPPWPWEENLTPQCGQL